MARPFELQHEIDIEATPEQVWEAIATGRGMDAWFMGENEVEPGDGGKARTSLPGFTMESTITTWDPPRRLVLDSGEAEDGRAMVFDYTIEGRRGGATRLRLVHSGFLPDDEWEAEVEALRTGNPAYLQKLAQYLKYFRGRPATPISAFGPQVDRERAWSVFKRALGLSGDVAEGDQVRFTPQGLPPIDGVVDYISPDFLGVRTQDGLYRFIHGLGGTVVLGHHIFADVDRQATERAWQSWVEQAFA